MSKDCENVAPGTVTLTPPSGEKQTDSTTRQYMAAMIINLLAFTQGNVVGWVSPSLPFLQSDHSPLAGGPISDESASWVGSIACLGGLAAVPIFTYLSTRHSRKVTGYLAGVLLVPSWLIILYTDSERSLFAARFIAGLSWGGGVILVSLFISEVAEDSLRGRLGTYIAVFSNGGLLFTYILGSCVSYRTLCFFSLTVVALFIVLFALIPESPYYLVYKGNIDQAKTSLKWLRGENEELVELEIERLSERVAKLKINYPNKSFLETLFLPGVLKGLLIGVGLFANLNLCGFMAVLSYSVNIFEESGSSVSPYVAAVIIAALRLGASYTSSLLVDRVGRKVLLIGSNAVMAVCLSALGGYFYLRQSIDMRQYGILLVVSLSVYIIALSLGVSTLPYLILHEILPVEARSLATITCQCVLWLFSFLVIKYFQSFKDILEIHGCYWFYATCCTVFTLFCYLCVPETKNRSLESILQGLSGGNNIPEEDNERKSLRNL
uniref:Major facilitator superfamily (MFS) profile domain-containing protein n=1 Tax=Timema tahoe TaxID=61484 RepID=A0A7R9ISZ8_9NEOP|nr:unnamed protein product [Timema tahoe]